VEETWNLRRYRSLVRYWAREGPPVHIVAAAALGLRRPSARAADVLSGDDLTNFIAAFPGGEPRP
jgi:hypothetical protein